MLLSIYKLDGAPNQDAICVLEQGEHVIGRGELLECNDRRISRNHASIRITNDSATITSTHGNPCFYQSANSKTIIILPKDSPTEIRTDDKFGLFPDQFWFRVHVEEEKLQNRYLINNNCNPSEINTVQLEETQTVDNKDDIQFDGALKRLSECESEARSKIPRLDESEGRPESAHLTLVKINEENNSVSAANSSVNNINTAENFGDVRKEERSDSESDSIPSTNEIVNGVPSTTSNQIISNITDLFETSETNTNAAKQEGSDFETENKLFEEEIATNNVSVAHTSDVNETAVGNGGEEVESNEKVAGQEKKKTNGDPDEPSSSGISSSTDNKARERCWYGSNCYRKSAMHRVEFSHPGDADYDSDPNDNRPVCSYGAVCYRRNKDHRREYKHSRVTRGAQKILGKRRKRKGDGTATKKPKPTDESSEDDYDYDDPFLDDGSEDEYEEELWSDDDSDEEWKDSQNASDDEDTKDLLKEAKRFTRKKK